MAQAWLRDGKLNTGALIISIGFWVILYYNYSKEPPKWYCQLLRPLTLVRFRVQGQGIQKAGLTHARAFGLGEQG